MIPTSKLKQLSTKGLKSGALIQFCRKPSCSWQSEKAHLKCPECSTSTGLVRYDDEFKTRIGKPKRARTEDGEYKGDDPKTPDKNEAYVGGKGPDKAPAKKPAAKKAPAKKKAKTK